MAEEPEKEDMAEDKPEEEPEKEDMAEDKPEEEPEKEDMSEDKPEEEPEEEEMASKECEEDMAKEIPCEEKAMETVVFEAEDSEEFSEKCKEFGAKFICKAGEYAVYSVDGSIFASTLENFEEKFEVEVSLNFNVQKTVVGGVDAGEVQTVAPMKVSFEKSVTNMFEKIDSLENNFEEASIKSEELQAKLNSYMCKELSNKFDEISFDANITVAEKAEWKNRISKSEFSNADELIEKFGGFVFKKNIESKNSSYASETIVEKINSRKSYEDIISQYMTDK